MGPAPKWCSFLDNLTEELEANPTSTGALHSILCRPFYFLFFLTLALDLVVYDDYKFLVGTNVLRAYMHGYFMDIRLYKKAKLITEPFNFEEFKQRKIKEKLDKDRENRTRVINKLPQVNSELAKRLIEDKQSNDPKNKKNKVIQLMLRVTAATPSHASLCTVS